MNLKNISILSLLALAFLAYVSAQCGVACDSDKGVCTSDGSYCNCFSNQDNSDGTGLDCDTRISACDTSMGNLTELETNYVPSIVDFRFASGNLVLDISGPMVNDRQYTSINLASDGVANECGFPGDDWTKALVNEAASSNACSDRWLMSADWDVDHVSDCAWAEDLTNEGYAIYTSYVEVNHHDRVSEFRGVPIYRDTSHVFPLKITFDLEVTVDTSISVFAPVNTLAAVTLQQYEPQLEKGTVAVTTSLQWPFKIEIDVSNEDGLTHPTDGSLEANVSDTTDYSGALCLDFGADPACLQTFTIDIDPVEACTLTGPYSIKINVVCRPDQTDCPLQGSDGLGSLDLQINSEDFCTEAEIDIELAGTLASYEADSYLEADLRDDFFINVESFYKAELSTSDAADPESDGGIALADSEFKDIWVAYTPEGGSETNIFMRSCNGAGVCSTTAEGAIWGFEVDTTTFAADPYSLAFSFSSQPEDDIVVGATTISGVGAGNGLPLAVDENMVVSVYAKIRVAYQGGVGARTTTLSLGELDEQRLLSVTRQAAESDGEAGLNTDAQVYVSAGQGDVTVNQNSEDGGDGNTDGTTASAAAALTSFLM